MADRLGTYKKKRDFEKSPEPKGRGRGKPGDGRFVVQEHHARRLHWDLRLEHEGTLASWALPRGVPEHPDENRLAVRTEDHPLEYLEFEGEIPKGEYGAGTMKVWDRGTYEAEKFRDDEVIAVFHGERMRGRYALFRTRENDWMIHRMDPPEDPAYEPMPKRIKPMLARSGKLPPREEQFGFEVKWDGIRTVAFCDHGHIELQGRNFTDFTPRYPEVRELARSLGARRVVLDGEVVAFDEEGRPSFERLQARMHLASESAVRRRMRDIPATYVIFDLLYLDGHSTIALSYEERRSLLERLELEGPAWRTPAYHRGEGSGSARGHQGARHRGGGGEEARLPVPARRARLALDQGEERPHAGRRDRRLDPGRGRSRPSLGALAVGVYEGERLVYVGKVGTGFTEQTLALLRRELEPLRRDASPFGGRQPPKGTIFVEPRLVAHVEFREWTGSGTLRAPSFKGLRPDISPQECVREEG